MAATIVIDSFPASLAETRHQCLGMTRRRAGLSALAAFVPLPGINLVTDVAVLVSLLDETSRRFGLTADQIDALSPKRRVLAYKLVTEAGNFLVTRLATPQIVGMIMRRAGLRFGIMEATRLAPIVGQSVAAVIAYVTLTRIARRHIEDCAAITARLQSSD